MFNIFKSKTPTVEPKAVTKGKTTNEIIEEIHESFYTEVDKLLAEAKITNSLDTTKQDLIDKYERLKALGFTNTVEGIEAQNEISRLRNLESDNVSKKSLIEAINYFSFKYPHYKFITEKSVKKICKKYNLVYGEISRYIGTVPDENLKHIEDFKILEEDECYLHEDISTHMGSRYVFSSKYITTEMANIERSVREPFSSSSVRKEINKCPLEIAAPVKDFNMSGLEVKDFKLSKVHIPDPVVLKPVLFKGQKHFLVITAWGLEASDELVVNTNNN